MVSLAQTADARVLSMLRTKGKTRYQIQEMLGESHSNDAVLNRLLENMYAGNLVERHNGILYFLSTRGQAALQLLDLARNRRQVEAAEWAPEPIGERIPPSMLLLMKRSPPRGCASPADLRPAAHRAGSRRFLDFPSRFGDTLRYRDGRVTDMAGTPVTTLR